MRAIGKLHRDIDEWTAAIARRGRAQRQVDEQLTQLGARLVRMFDKTGVDIRPELLVPAQQVMAQQVLFGLELPVQAHLIDAGAFHYRIDADISGALEIKEILGSVQDSCVCHRACGDLALRAFPANGHGFKPLSKMLCRTKMLPRSKRL